MHDGQFDFELVEIERAITATLPGRRGLSVRPVNSSGTVVKLFRVAEDLVARFPLVPRADASMRMEISSEQDHARAVAAYVPIQVPEPVALCEPFDGYPGWWSIWTWLSGESVQSHNVFDLGLFARQLAGFVRSYHSMPTDGRSWDGTCRGGAPLAEIDEWVRYSITHSTHLVDTAAVTRIWEECLEADHYFGPAVFIHTDLVPGNLLVRDGQLVAAIDLGTPHFGDPAADLTPAWHILDTASRRIWCSELVPDEATWTRGKGWALEQAIGALHYYEHSNNAMFLAAQRTLNELIVESREASH